MGDPKNPRRAWKKPRNPLNYDLKMEELKTLGTFGLKTIVQKKFSFKTPYQARQAVVHGHIMIGDRIVSVPSYSVGMNEENQIHLASGSSLGKLLEQHEKAKIEEPHADQPELETPEESKDTNSSTVESQD